MHRALVVSLVAALALASVGSAAAVTVHVRVEGWKKTIFGAQEPRLTPFTGELVAADGAPVSLVDPTPLGALEAASRRGEFFYRMQASAFGPFVDQIGRNAASASRFWVYKVNGAFAPVGAADLVLEDGDRVLWYMAPFDPTGVGPDTLELSQAGSSCYRALAVDANGGTTRARDVVFRLDHRPVRSKSGKICPRGHWHKLRATKAGAVRSELVRR